MTRAMTAAVLACCATGALGMGDKTSKRPDQHLGHQMHTIPGNQFPGCGKAEFAAAMIKAGFGPGGESTYPLAIRSQSSLSETDLQHVDLDIEIFYSTRVLAGTSTMHLESLTDGLTTFTFQLASNMNISLVTVDGVGAPFTTAPNGERVATLPATQNIGDAFVVAVTYDGATVSGQFGSIEWGQITDMNSPVDPFPVRSKIVNSLSQPYYSYTWWPCKDTAIGGEGDYSDKFTLDFSITGPTEFSSTANGVLQSIEVLPGDRRKFNYSHSYQIPTYLVAFASSEYNTEQRIWNYGDISMPLDVWFTKANDNIDTDYFLPREEWFKMGDMLTVFSDLWGVYPFHEERYGMYEFVFSGGMEHQTNTGQLGWYFADWLTAHEAAHQWWGDWVTCKTWHDIWFQEGMASYAEVLYEEFKPGVADPEAERVHQMTDYYTPHNFNGSAYVYDTSNPERMFNYDHTYLRGGWIWHMIRGMAGDAAFFQALEEFAARYGQSGATTDEIRVEMEASTGLDFTELFDDYVYGRGAPEYEYGWDTTTVNGQDYLQIQVVQTQDPAFGADGVFNVPVPVVLNDTETISVTPRLPSHYFVVPTASPTDYLDFDPLNWVLKQYSAEGLMGEVPPVVLTASADESSASFSFIERVNASSANFSVLTDDLLGSPQAFTYSYSFSTNTSTLDFGAGLAPGDYIITVSDSIVSFGDQVALDGDGVDGAVPSGNGAPGGDFVYRFSVVNPCQADMNGDSFLDIGDITLFVSLFLEADFSADMNGDGFLDIGDITTFVSLFLAGC